ncbi:hypothetical protein [Candidatus Marithrix sp. Canyon 246]|uniref:hypothetical protein n=1 Tax=Candidatus Marithrix sp. Canyon 246 TaxID=1827136 RepID=UPI000849FEF6|nr:hypothetical protein [Candidatus Marithrix sp. Canyon 246]
MNNFPRKKLQELINSHGNTICEDQKRCEAWLQDMCAGKKKYKAEIFALINALKQRVAADLLNPPRGLPKAALFNRLVQRLYDNVGLDKKVAAWAVESWALALGVEIKSSLTKNINYSQKRINILLTIIWLLIISILALLVF